MEIVIFTLALVSSFVGLYGFLRLSWHLIGSGKMSEDEKVDYLVEKIWAFIERLDEARS